MTDVRSIQTHDIECPRCKDIVPIDLLVTATHDDNDEMTTLYVVQQANDDHICDF